MQNAWHAITTDFSNTTREHHGVFNTQEEALESAFEAATDQEVCFAIQEDPDYPSEEYAGLPEGIEVEELTFPQVATVQRWCRYCLADVTAELRTLLTFSAVAMRRASWDAACGMWHYDAVEVLRDGSTRMPQMTAATKQVV